MSSRFPPSSGFNSRDRSPRFGDRRTAAGPRGPDDGNIPFGREPPSAPRALRGLVDSPRGHFGGRGRGYGRGEFRDRDRDIRDRDRDREFRDRDAPPFRRDMDRDWGRRDRDFDPRDNRIGFGRGRSRSPARDFRDAREPPAAILTWFVCAVTPETAFCPHLLVAQMVHRPMEVTPEVALCVAEEEGTGKVVAAEGAPRSSMTVNSFAEEVDLVIHGETAAEIV
ncbi:hypothetical protein N7507_002468 [Penicillium longicatenatum]|nr:hypothetical protein N7507_002468 [Penicillium longicatenatum]